MLVPALRDRRAGAQDDHDREGNVDEERPTPPGPVHQDPADEGADRAGNAPEGRPGPDGDRPVGLSEAGLQDCHASGREERAAHPLEDPRVATSTPMLGANPHTNDAPANHAVPMRKMRRLPRRSPNAPARRMNEASPSR